MVESPMLSGAIHFATLLGVPVPVTLSAILGADCVFCS
jgi:hypothetical protein